MIFERNIFFAVTSLGAVLLAWRLWRFTIVPLIWPRQAKELPYWIPVVGHVISFLRNPQALMTYGRHFFGNTRDIFTLTLAGQTIYVVTKPSDIAAVYKNHANLTFEGYVKDLYAKFGMSKEGMAKFFIEGEADAHTKSGAFRQHPVLGPNLPDEQLRPGSIHYEDASTLFKENIQAQLDPTSLPRKAFVDGGLLSKDGRQVVSLRNWTAEVLGRSTALAFFGASLLEIDENILEDLRIFDTHSWQMLYKQPRFMAKEMYGARDRILRSFKIYFEQPEEKRADSGHWIGNLTRLQREQDMSSQDMATSALLIFWVANGNPPKVTFWLLGYILHNPVLANRIRAELGSSNQPNSSIDFARLTDPQHAPLLNAAFNETLRLTTANSSARDVEVRTTIGTTELLPGGKVLVPFQQLHLADEFYPDPYAFHPERFLENPKLDKADFFRPFGGGLAYCPGRYLTKRGVLGFAAVVLMSYETEIVGDKRMPRLDLATPSPGTIDPMEQEDVLLAIKRRDWVAEKTSLSL